MIYIFFLSPPTKNGGKWLSAEQKKKKKKKGKKRENSQTSIQTLRKVVTTDELLGDHVAVRNQHRAQNGQIRRIRLHQGFIDQEQGCIAIHLLGGIRGNNVPADGGREGLAGGGDHRHQREDQDHDGK